MIEGFDETRVFDSSRLGIHRKDDSTVITLTRPAIEVRVGGSSWCFVALAESLTS